MALKIDSILTSRSFELNPSFQLLTEWEDDLAASLGVPVVEAKPLYRKLLLGLRTRKWYRTVNAGGQLLEGINNAVERYSHRRRTAGPRHYRLAYELYTAVEPSFTTAPNTIPIMVDYWKHTNLQQFNHTYRHCPLVFISSLETFEFLKASGCTLNIEHLALSLSDRYRLTAEQRYEKQYDILLAGRLDVRTNQVLRDYLQEFVAKNPTVEYLYQQEIDGEFHYVSNLRGTIGKFQTRADYMRLLRASKISFYSTPGLDGGEKRTGGFNPVTPRYLELLSAQCLLLGRYPQNEETDFYELPRVCPNVNSYAEFEALMHRYLADKNPSFDDHRAVLDKHYTSKRAERLLGILQRQA